MHTTAITVRRLLVLLVITAGTSVPVVAQTSAPGYRQMVVVTAATTPVEMGTVTRTLTVIARANRGASGAFNCRRAAAGVVG